MQAGVLLSDASRREFLNIDGWGLLDYNCCPPRPPSSNAFVFSALAGCASAQLHTHTHTHTLSHTHTHTRFAFTAFSGHSFACLAISLQPFSVGWSYLKKMKWFGGCMFEKYNSGHSMPCLNSCSVSPPETILIPCTTVLFLYPLFQILIRLPSLVACFSLSFQVSLYSASSYLVPAYYWALVRKRTRSIKMAMANRR